MAFANKARFWRATDPPPANAFAALVLLLGIVASPHKMNEVQHRGGGLSRFLAISSPREISYSYLSQSQVVSYTPDEVADSRYIYM